MSKAEEVMLVERRGKKSKRRRLPLPGRGQGFKRVEQGSVSLLVPEGKRSWAHDELIFRSFAVCKGEISSVGLPKFFAVNEDPALAADLDRALRAGEVFLTRKHDGSLGIRSVDRGRVSFRTRNSLTPDHLTEMMRRIAAERYPVLTDPEFAGDMSLHFELVTPHHRVVLPYESEDLILIGGVRHSNLRLLDVPELEELASEHGLRCAEQIPAPASVAEIQALVDADPDTEGVVARFADGQQLAKIKGAPYMQAHRRRFILHPKRIADACQRKQIESVERLARHLGLSDDDPEMDYIDELFERFRQLETEVEQTIGDLERLLDPDMSRKQVAALAEGRPAAHGPALHALHQSDTKRARRLLMEQGISDRFGDPTAQPSSA